MGRFMDDDIMRQAGKNQLARICTPTLARVTIFICCPLASRLRKITEHERPVLFRIKGIRLRKGMRRNLKLVTKESPANSTSQGRLKPRQRAHDDCVGVLGV